VNLADHQILFRNRKEENSLSVNRSLQMLSLPVELKSSPLNIATKESRGSVNVSIITPRVIDSLCGWFWRINNDQSGVKVWIVLHNKVLNCLTDEYENLSNSRCRLLLSDIKSVSRLGLYCKEISRLADSMIIRFSSTDPLVLAWADDCTHKGVWMNALSKTYGGY